MLCSKYGREDGLHKVSLCQALEILYIYVLLYNGYLKLMLIFCLCVHYILLQRWFFLVKSVLFCQPEYFYEHGLWLSVSIWFQPNDKWQDQDEKCS